MFFHFPQVLSTELLQECQTLLADAPWGDGKVTAGSQSALVKNNLQLPESHPITQRLRACKRANKWHPRFGEQR